jgi:transcriptional antiterminator NusG
MSKRWYVVHAYSGFEKSVQRALEDRIRRAGMEEHFGRIMVPTEEVVELKGGQKLKSERKFYPGYILVHMKLLDDKNQLVERSWYFVRETPGLIGFVGGERPVPLKPDEVENILAQIQERQDKVAPKVAFETGETVKITDGPFQNFTGVIEEVDAARGKLKISVSIFGRSTPVELEYWQVERA